MIRADVQRRGPRVTFVLDLGRCCRHHHFLFAFNRPMSTKTNRQNDREHNDLHKEEGELAFHQCHTQVLHTALQPLQLLSHICQLRLKVVDVLLLLASLKTTGNITM